MVKLGCRLVAINNVNQSSYTMYFRQPFSMCQESNIYNINLRNKQFCNYF